MVSFEIVLLCFITSKIRWIIQLIASDKLSHTWTGSQRNAIRPQMCFVCRIKHCSRTKILCANEFCLNAIDFLCALPTPMFLPAASFVLLLGLYLIFLLKNFRRCFLLSSTNNLFCLVCFACRRKPLFPHRMVSTLADTQRTNVIGTLLWKTFLRIDFYDSVTFYP